VSSNQEENALQTNLEAAEEIARQLRLRDIGGIIVVDFIDMKLPENKRKLHEAMEGFMKIDRAKHAVLAISKFGLMQLTRQRMKPEMNINTQEQCPSCQGTGKISSTLVLEDEIEKNISYLSEQKHKSLVIAVHPILYAYLTKGLISKRRRWSWAYKMSLTIKSNSNYHLTEFHFFDNNEEEIRL
jgi:ribonuclease G